MSVTRLEANEKIPQVVLGRDGDYRLNLPGGKTHFTAVWDNAPGVAPAGTLTFSVDGNPGDPPGIIDLAGADNSFAYNVRVPLVDVTVSGLPAGGRVLLYCY